MQSTHLLAKRGVQCDAGVRCGTALRPDTAIFDYARAFQTTIITLHTDYLNQTAFSPPHAGILVFRSIPRDRSVNELASAVLKAVAQLAHLDISNRVYRFDPSGLEEEL